MCRFVEKKKKALCLVEHISTKKRHTLFVQPPYYSNPSYYSELKSKTILKCQDHLRVKLYLFKKILGPVGAIWGN